MIIMIQKLNTNNHDNAEKSISLMTSTDNSFNINKCWARLKKDPSKQCTNQKKDGYDFCGKHITLTIFDNDQGHIINDLRSRNAILEKENA